MNEALITALWRQRQDLRRAELRLNLQCQSVCRREAGSREGGAKLWTQVQKGTCPNDGLVMVLTPYRLAMSELDMTATGIEKQLEKLAKAHPLWAWCETVRGLGALSLAGLIGEAGRPLTDYRTVSCLWKRFGLAVIEGQRQRRVTDAELAVIHGYSPQRRAFTFVISECLLRAGRKGDRFRDLYDARKAIETERVKTPIHAHKRALRLMAKEMLKEAWVAARAAERPPKLAMAAYTLIKPASSPSSCRLGGLRPGC